MKLNFHPTKPPTDQPTDRSNNRTTVRPTNQPTDRPTNFEKQSASWEGNSALSIQDIPHILCNLKCQHPIYFLT